jgi:hypothetical protein
MVLAPSLSLPQLKDFRVPNSCGDVGNLIAFLRYMKLTGNETGIVMKSEVH